MSRTLWRGLRRRADNRRGGKNSLCDNSVDGGRLSVAQCIKMELLCLCGCVFIAEMIVLPRVSQVAYNLVHHPLRLELRTHDPIQNSSKPSNFCMILLLTWSDLYLLCCRNPFISNGSKTCICAIFPHDPQHAGVLTFFSLLELGISSVVFHIGTAMTSI